MDGRTDGRAIGKDTRYGGRRDAARPAESRSALGRHRALEKLQQPSDIPAPHSLSLTDRAVYTCESRPALVCAQPYTGACLPACLPARPSASVCMYICGWVDVCVCVCVYSTEYSYQRAGAIPATVLQRRTSRARAYTGLVGGVRSGARAHRGPVPFSYHRRYYHHRDAHLLPLLSCHIDTLSVFLPSPRIPRAAIPLSRAFSSPRYSSPALFFFFRFFFVLIGEGYLCVPRDNFG